MRQIPRQIALQPGERLRQPRLVAKRRVVLPDAPSQQGRLGDLGNPAGNPLDVRNHAIGLLRVQHRHQEIVRKLRVHPVHGEAMKDRIPQPHVAMGDPIGIDQWRPIAPSGESVLTFITLAHFRRKRVSPSSIPLGSAA